VATYAKSESIRYQASLVDQRLWITLWISPCNLHNEDHRGEIRGVFGVPIPESPWIYLILARERSGWWRKGCVGHVGIGVRQARVG
jgi:hypothetical protein